MSTATEKPVKMEVIGHFELITTDGIYSVNVKVGDKIVNSTDTKLINLLQNAAKVRVQAPMIHKDLQKAA